MGYKRMDKGRRSELTKLKFKKRLNQVGFSMEDVHKPNNNLWAYKSTGKPCSCFICSGRKYDRAKEDAVEREMIDGPMRFETPNAEGYLDM
jgi:hypothetical protein